MNGDLIDGYLARLRAGLRTPPVRTAEIVAEAEDHLRESAAARRAAGLDEATAQRAAIAAFGPVKQVTSAHQPRPADYAAAAAWRVWPLFAGYLLLSALIGGLLVAVEMARTNGHVMGNVFYTFSDGHGVTETMEDTSPDPGQLAAVFGGCALAGLLVLAGFLLVRRRGRTAAAVPLPRGLFPLGAGTGLLALAIAEAQISASGGASFLLRVTGAIELFSGSMAASVVLGAACAVCALVSLSVRRPGAWPREAAVEGHGAGPAVPASLAASRADAPPWRTAPPAPARPVGPARARERARRTPVRALAAAAGLTAWSLLTCYLLLSVALGGILLYLDAAGRSLLTAWAGGIVGYVNAERPRGPLADPGLVAASFGGCALAGLLLLAGLLFVRGRRQPGLVPARPPRGLSLPVSVTGLTLLAIAEYQFFVGDVLGQLPVADGIACLVLGSQWAAVVLGAGCGLRTAAALAGWTRESRVGPPPENADLARA